MKKEHTINFTVFYNELNRLLKKKYQGIPKPSIDSFCFTKDEVSEALRASGIPNEIISNAIETLVVEYYLQREDPSSVIFKISPVCIH